MMKALSGLRPNGNAMRRGPFGNQHMTIWGERQTVVKYVISFFIFFFISSKGTKISSPVVAEKTKTCPCSDAVTYSSLFLHLTSRNSPDNVHKMFKTTSPCGV